MELIYEFPEPLSVRVEDVEVSLAYSFTQDGDYRNHASLTQTTGVRFQFDEPVPFERAWSHHRYHLQNYLTLATGASLQPTTVMAQSPHATMVRGAEEPQRVPLEICLRVPDAEAEARDKLPDFMLFTLSDLGVRFEQSLVRWFARATLLGPVIDLYFGLRYEPDVYLNSQFLSLVQALEVFDRRVGVEGQYLPSDTFSVIQEELTALLPEELDAEVIQVFKSRIAFLNELGLKRRLRRLCEARGQAAELLIPDIGRFVSKAGNTRNFLTHYAPGLEVKAAKDEDLYWLVLQTRFLLELSLLAEVGFENTEIHELVSGNQRYLQHAHGLRAAIEAGVA